MSAACSSASLKKKWDRLFEIKVPKCFSAIASIRNAIFGCYTLGPSFRHAKTTENRASTSTRVSNIVGSAILRQRFLEAFESSTSLLAWTSMYPENDREGSLGGVKGNLSQIWRQTSFETFKVKKRPVVFLIHGSITSRTFFLFKDPLGQSSPLDSICSMSKWGSAQSTTSLAFRFRSRRWRAATPSPQGFRLPMAARDLKGITVPNLYEVCLPLYQYHREIKIRISKYFLPLLFPKKINPEGIYAYSFCLVMILLVFFWYSWKLSQHTLALYMASSPDKKQTVRPGEPLLTSPSMPGQKIRKMLTDVVSRCHQNDQKKSNLVCPPARAFAFAQLEPHHHDL